MQLKYYLACGKLKQGPLGMATFLFSLFGKDSFLEWVTLCLKSGAINLILLQIPQGSRHKGLHKPKSKYSSMQKNSYWIAKTTVRLSCPSTVASCKNEGLSLKWELHTFRKPFPYNEEILREDVNPYFNHYLSLLHVPLIYHILDNINVLLTQLYDMPQ